MRQLLFLNQEYAQCSNERSCLYKYSVDGKQLFYVRYRKNAHTTWYAFYEELEEVYSIVYLANNQHIGHLLDINL